jgi:hypothetical protein
MEKALMEMENRNSTQNILLEYLLFCVHMVLPRNVLPGIYMRRNNPATKEEDFEKFSNVLSDNVRKKELKDGKRYRELER